MITPTAEVFQTPDGRTWTAVECFTENLGKKDGSPKMTWQVLDDTNKVRGHGYLYKTAHYKAGIAAAKRCAKRRALKDQKDRMAKAPQCLYERNYYEVKAAMQELSDLLDKHRDHALSLDSRDDFLGCVGDLVGVVRNELSDVKWRLCLAFDLDAERENITFGAFQIPETEDRYSNVEAGQVWKDNNGGYSVILWVKEGTICSDYRQNSCDSRHYPVHNSFEEFFEYPPELLTDRDQVMGAIPGELKAVAECFYGTDPEDVEGDQIIKEDNVVAGQFVVEPEKKG